MIGGLGSPKVKSALGGLSRLICGAASATVVQAAARAAMARVLVRMVLGFIALGSLLVGYFSDEMGGFAAAAFALVVATVSIFTTLHPGVVVRLAAPDNRLVYEIAHFDRSLKVTRVAGETAPPGKVHQLWLISPGEAPIALGLLEGQSQMIDRAAPVPGTRFAVSLEPEGGAVAGRPTGPMILMTNLLR